MAQNSQLSYASVNIQANALAPYMNSGKLRIYSGTIPTRCDDSLGAAVLLAELTMGSTAWGSAANGVLTANAVTGANAGVSGTHSFFRVFDSAGTTAYIQGTSGTSAADLILNAATTTAGVAVGVTALTHTVVRGA